VDPFADRPLFLQNMLQCKIALAPDGTNRLRETQRQSAVQRWTTWHLAIQTDRRVATKPPVPSRKEGFEAVFSLCAS